MYGRLHTLNGYEMKTSLCCVYSDRLLGMIYLKCTFGGNLFILRVAVNVVGILFVVRSNMHSYYGYFY